MNAGVVRGAGAAVAVGLGLALWLNSAPPSGLGGLVEISKGASARAIAGQMRERGHVRSALWFEALARVSGSEAKLKAGVYRIAAHQGADRILRDLVRGQGATLRVTVPEGFAVWQIGERLEAAGVCRAQDFKRQAMAWEGFLFPETYHFDPGTSEEEVIQVLRQRFDAVWGEVFHAADTAGHVQPLAPGSVSRPRDPDDVFRLSDGRKWTVLQTVTLASMIERETRLPEERARVSAVYHNRLKKRMRLECDPTVQYALGGWKSPLYKKDLMVESPYNTYRRYGLPPGPIANPGRDALAAALAPAPVNDLYFVSDGAGGHRFSSTYADHQKAVGTFRNALKNGRNRLQ